MATNLLHGKPAAREKFTDRMKRKALTRAIEQMEQAS